LGLELTEVRRIGDCAADLPDQHHRPS
jgi:hypothetical protein